MDKMDKHTSLEDLDFSVRTWKCLKNAGVKTLGDLMAKTPSDLKELRGMGNKSLQEISDKFHELGVDTSGFDVILRKPFVDEKSRSFVAGELEPGTMCPDRGGVTHSTPARRPLWAEVRNDFFESGADLRAEDGDVLARISIDAWKTEDENEDGSVIACVMLSKHGDVLVDYRDNLARYSGVAQEAITEAKEQLRNYFLELQELQEDLNDAKTDKIIYFSEGHFKTRVELREIAVAAAEDFIAKVNKPSGKKDSKHCFTYDFGSPYDELDMYAEYMVGGDNTRKSWWTVCSLYTKGESPDMTAVQSVESVHDVNDIATTILELVEELDCKIEIEFVQEMKAKLEALDREISVDDKLRDADAKAGESKRNKEDVGLEM